MAAVNPNVKHVEFPNGSDGPLDHGTRFAFETSGGRIQFVVDEFVPYSRLVWSGANIEISVRSTWLFRSVADGCHVVSEAAANGPGALGIRRADASALDRDNERFDQGPEARVRIAQMIGDRMAHVAVLDCDTRPSRPES